MYRCFPKKADNIPFEEKKGWHTYWCVDPLDGTREFVKRNGEFTVNIALIRDGKPVIGVIYVPGVQRYSTMHDQASGAWKAVMRPYRADPYQFRYGQLDGRGGRSPRGPGRSRYACPVPRSRARCRW